MFILEGFLVGNDDSAFDEELMHTKIGAWIISGNYERTLTYEKILQ